LQERQIEKVKNEEKANLKGGKCREGKFRRWKVQGRQI
jgi:hypothetical protein